MNVTQTQKSVTDNPEAFATWIIEISDIQEKFAEILHNTADIIAVNDPKTAMSLYQAADITHATVYALRNAKPHRGDPVQALGRFCALLMTYILELI
jgi:hypothetical protein